MDQPIHTTILSVRCRIGGTLRRSKEPIVPRHDSEFCLRVQPMLRLTSAWWIFSVIPGRHKQSVDVRTMLAKFNSQRHPWPSSMKLTLPTPHTLPSPTALRHPSQMNLHISLHHLFPPMITSHVPKPSWFSLRIVVVSEHRWGRR